MVEIIFKDGKIQKGYRVKIPKAVVDTLRFKEGERIVIYFNANKKRLTIERDKGG